MGEGREGTLMNLYHVGKRDDYSLAKYEHDAKYQPRLDNSDMAETNIDEMDDLGERPAQLGRLRLGLSDMLAPHYEWRDAKLYGLAGGFRRLRETWKAPRSPRPWLNSTLSERVGAFLRTELLHWRLWLRYVLKGK